jgi:hypothetical protein
MAFSGDLSEAYSLWFLGLVGDKIGKSGSRDQAWRRRQLAYYAFTANEGRKDRYSTGYGPSENTSAW